MNFLYIICAILILAFIIVIHELGHFTMGRILGFGIEEFSVGFGPAIASRKRGGIRYALRPFIVGGYVRFTGEDEESDDPKAFNNQRVWKRFLVVLAGPLMNFVLAYIAAVIFLAGFGLYETVPRVDGVDPSLPAALSGIQAGDVITRVDDTNIAYSYEGFLDMVDAINAHDRETPLSLTVRRGAETVELETGLYLAEDGTYKMGITMDSDQFPLSFGDSVSFAGELMFRLTREVLSALKNLIFRGEGLDQVSGTVGIVSEVSRTMADGVSMAIYWIMVISANLGIMNLLPLPALDGGRLLFLIIEGIRRKPFPRDKEGLVNLIGLAMFFLLFIVLTWHDIAKIIAG